jgi:D-alanyl-D-alanine carboxypeptidase
VRAIVLVAVLVAGCTVEAASPASSLAPVTPSAPASLEAEPFGGPEQLVAPSSGIRPAQPEMTARLASVLVADHCVDRDLVALAADDVALTVLDRSYALPAAYVPADLVPAAEAGLTGASGTKLVRAVIVDDLRQMHADWAAAGLTIVIESAYRSYASQAGTFNSWVSRIGVADALRRSARPGHSEHQLGTTLDVTSPGWGGRFGNWATETAEGAWLAENAWRYGFVMSYPLGADAQTCFGYEPWHYRWIGREAAAAHRTSGLQLRQFLERFVNG